MATRPSAQNGLGISSAEASAKIEDIRNTYTFINDPDNLFAAWHQLIQQYQPVGKSAHDTRLVAFMQSEQINRIYTMNPNHFNHFSDIITILN